VIPGKIVRFLDQYANIAFAGTRDRHLAPCGHRVSGWRLGDDGRTLTMLVAEPIERLIEALEDNGQIALTIEEFPSHETYQFKGRYVRRRPLEPGDVEIAERVRDRFMRALQPVYGDMALGTSRAFMVKPCLAVEFEVREVYVQTPGPGAAARLVPPTET
jgi:hypothetical protein